MYTNMSKEFEHTIYKLCLVAFMFTGDESWQGPTQMEEDVFR